MAKTQCWQLHSFSTLGFAFAINSRFDLQHRPGAGNRVADGLSRNSIDAQPSVQESSKEALVSAFVGKADRCQSCWGRARAFSARGGSGGNTVMPSTSDHLRERASEVVLTETQLPGRESREVFETDPNTGIKRKNLLEETIALRQYVEQVPAAKLP